MGRVVSIQTRALAKASGPRGETLERHARLGLLSDFRGDAELGGEGLQRSLRGGRLGLLGLIEISSTSRPSGSRHSSA
jgi:hypothetical protein